MRAPCWTTVFILCNGDSVFACNLARFLGHGLHDQAHRNWILLRAVDDLDRYGSVRLYEGSHRVESFCPRSEPGVRGLINSGIYLLDHSVFDYVTENCSLEQSVLPRLAEAGDLGGIVLDGYFRDIGLRAIWPPLARNCRGSLSGQPCSSTGTGSSTSIMAGSARGSASSGWTGSFRLSNA